MKMKINLADIKIDATTYIRAGIDHTVAEEYARLMKEGAVFPPVSLYSDGEHIRVCDGHHRLEAMAKNGEKEVDALILTGDRESMLLTALRENSQHGVRLTGDDRRHAIRLVHREFPNRSQIGIAMIVGCTQGYVSQVLNEAEDITTNDLPTSPTSSVTGKAAKKCRARRGRGTLAHLKRHWKVATPADRDAFLRWVEEEERDNTPVLADSGTPADPDGQPPVDGEQMVLRLDPPPAGESDEATGDCSEPPKDDGPARGHDEQDESGG